MCVCIWKPAGKKVAKSVLEKCWAKNRHGAGYMWAVDGKVCIRKGFMSFKKFWKSYNKAMHNMGNPGMGIHFRIGTSGMLDSRNCHPHRIHSGLAFIHNGILPLEVPKNSTVSDSVLFSQLLESLPDGWHLDSKIKTLVEMAMGGRNKICLLDVDGNVVLLNEDAGQWVDGVWFSNMHWDKKPVLTDPQIWTGEFSEKSWKNYKADVFRPGAGTKKGRMNFKSAEEVYGCQKRDSAIEDEDDYSEIIDENERIADEICDRFLATREQLPSV